MAFGRPYFHPESIDAFKELLAQLDFYRKIGDLPEAGNTAVRISNSLQFAGSPDLSYFYLHLADSLYSASGQTSRRMNVRLNEPLILCRSGRLDEGRERMEALLRDSNALRDPLGREIMLRNHYSFFKDSISLFDGYRIISSLSQDPNLQEYLSEVKILYEALMCDHYMEAGRTDSAAYYFGLSKDMDVSDWDFQMQVYAVRARYLESIGKNGEAFDLLRRCIDARDSVSSNNNAEKKAYLERIEAINQHQAEAERERHDLERSHYMIGGSLVILLLLSLIAIQWIRHRSRMKTMRLQMEAEKMERRILAMSISKEESAKVIDKVKEETARLKQDGIVSTKDLSEIETSIKMHLAGKEEMEAFEESFAEVSPEFADRLKMLSPTISPNNIRLCAYLYMGLSSQQVCGILNVTPGALRQAKRRLRQRFGLKGDDSLEDFLRALVKQ
ncbi:MAG: hypothetical protein K2H38_09275 [Muribaculaceae bacterium]|nr:hypothetical protein [Muribaculaceae bacterium]